MSLSHYHKLIEESCSKAIYSIYDGVCHYGCSEMFYRSLCLLKFAMERLAVSQNMVKLYDIVDIRRDLGNFWLFLLLKTWGLPLCLLPLTDTRESR
jgi:hypothetical protein